MRDSGWPAIIACCHTQLGAWFILLLLIAIFPANVEMAIDFYRQHNPHLWLAIVRLPLQLLLIYWTWVYRRAEIT